MLSIVLILFVAFASFQPIQADLTDVKTFAKSVLQRMDNYYADEMASLLKMDNFNAYINTTRNGWDIEGNVEFRSGFARAIIGYLANVRRLQNTTHGNETGVELLFIFRTFNAKYDQVYYKLKNYKVIGSAVIHFPPIEYVVTIVRTQDNHTVIRKRVEFRDTYDSQQAKIDLLPENGLTKAIAEEVPGKSNLQELIYKLLENGKIKLQAALNRIVFDIEYPQSYQQTN